MSFRTTRPAPSPDTRTGGALPSADDREDRARVRLVAAVLAVAALTVVAVLLWSPWPGRNNLAYTDLRPVRDAVWAGALVDAVATGVVAVTLGIAVAALARDRGAAWARAGAPATMIGGIASASGLAAMGVLVWYATDTAALPADQGAALLAHVDAQMGHVAVLLIPGFLLFTAGVLLLAVALWRAAAVPRWLPVTLVVLTLALFALPPGPAMDIAQAAQYAVFAGIAVQAWRLPHRIRRRKPVAPA